MKKILIPYASYGGGHLSAANNLKEYIETNYSDVEVIVFDYMRYINRVIDKVGIKAYSEINKNIPWLWGKIYYHTQDPIFERIFSLSNKILSYKLARIFRLEKPDIILSTHFFASHICSILKKNGKINSKIGTVITDYGKDPYNEWTSGHEYMDYIFVAHSGIKDTLIKKGINKNKIFDTGIPVSRKFIANYDKNEILKSLNFSLNKKTILFFGGGEMGLGKSKTLEIFDTLVKEHPEFQIIVIAGKNESLKKSFEEIVNHYNLSDSIKIFGFSNKIPEFMQISDLVFTKPGGLTTTECLISNLPIIIINPIPGQETENAEFIENSGCGIWIKKNDNISEVLNRILKDNNKLALMKDNTKLIAKPNSTRDICNVFMC